MPAATLGLGVLLILLGLVAFFASGQESVTALIPTFFGLPLLILGLLARAREGWRKHAMHAAAAIALLGLLGTITGIPKLLTLLGGGEVARPTAAVVQSVMALLCAIFVVLAVRSFIAARRARGM